MYPDLLVTITPYMRHLSSLNTSAGSSSATITDISCVIIFVFIFYIMMKYAKYGRWYMRNGKKISIFTRWNTIAAMIGIVCAIALIVFSGMNRSSTPLYAITKYKSAVTYESHLRKIYPKLKPNKTVKYMNLSHSLTKDVHTRKPHIKKYPGKIQVIHAYKHMQQTVKINNPAKLKKPAWYRYL